MDKPIFIRLLEYGEKVSLEGTNMKAVKDWAIENKYLAVPGSSDYENRYWLLNNLFNESFSKSREAKGEVWVLKNEYYFRLLEYRELEEARKASTQANRNAFWAIVIAIIALICSLAIGYFQINKPILLDSEQFNLLTRSITGSASVYQSQTESIIKTIKESSKKSVELEKIGE